MSSAVDPSAQGLVQQNIELRRKLEDEHGSYKRKLQAYQDGQQRQAQLVQKLQAKVSYNINSNQVFIGNTDDTRKIYSAFDPIIIKLSSHSGQLIQQP